MAATNIYHTVYQVTNIINGNFYIGKHSTDNPHDNYLGSSESIKDAIKKYGKENFRKDILFYCDSENKAYEIESLIVTEELTKLPECYNMKPGGYGFISGITSYIHPLKNTNRSEEVKEKLSKATKKYIEKNGNPFYGKNHSEKTKNFLKEKSTGRKHSEEERQKMSEKVKGENHPFYGKKRPDVQGENNPMNREEVKEKFKGGNSSRAKKCIINGKEFFSRVEAAEYFKVSPSLINKWLRNREN